MTETLETTKSFLREFDRTQLDFRAKRRFEVLGKSFWTPWHGSQRSSTYEVEHSLNLEEEVSRCWREAFNAYTYGLFQGSALLASVVVELLVEMFLRSKDLWAEYEKKYPDEDYRTFGTLIRFCDANESRGALVTSNILEKLRRIRDIRNEVTHMSIRRGVKLRVFPMEPPYNQMDEFERISVEVRDEKGKVNGAYSEEGEPVLIDNRDMTVWKVRAFKKYALEVIQLADEVSHMFKQYY